MGVRVRVRVRQVANVLNTSTLLGLAFAVAGRARIERGPHGVLLARDYRARFPAPRAPAVTIGDVVLLRLDDAGLAARPGLLDHESRHCGQYAWTVGPFGFLPAYLLASAWSWLHTRDFAQRNLFEVRAGLVDGGYLPHPEPAAALDGPAGSDGSAGPADSAGSDRSAGVVVRHDHFDRRTGPGG